MSSTRRKVVATAVSCIAVLLVGVTGRYALASLKKPPAQIEAREPALSVSAIRAEARDVEVIIPGTGQVRPLNVVAITPEVAGQVVEIHPRLEVGELIPKGETLFLIDPRTYQARYDEARAAVGQAEAAIRRLEAQYTTDQERLKTWERTRELARAEYERRKTLMEQDEVGTQSGVDTAEQAYMSARDAYDQLAQALTMQPLRIEEAKSALESATAAMNTARINLDRTRLVAPFDARVKSVAVELGQYVAPGTSAMGPGSAAVVLADDSLLEISVPLDSRTARQWLRFANHQNAPDVAWFGDLEPVTCRIRWTEDKDGHCWEGTLHRVEKFEEDTRTLVVAVRVSGEQALSQDVDKLPLVEGMFCSVEIPGKVVTGLYELPVWAVSFENTAYVAVDGRLKTVPVEVSHTQGESVFVSGGIRPGDIVVTTRLSNPLENSLLDIRFEDGRGASIDQAKASLQTGNAPL